MYRKEGEDLNLYNMLPFLDGWRGHYFTKQETVEKGKYKLVYSEMSTGWLIFFDSSYTDAYASVKFTYLGEITIPTPHALFIAGAVMPPPSGTYLLEYLRPSTLSTAGVYVVSNFTMAEPMPVKGLVRVELGLEDDSTQTTATAAVNFMYIEITDTVAFIRSVRRFLYGWLGWAFGVLSHIPGLKYVGIPAEIKEVVE